MVYYDVFKYLIKIKKKTKPPLKMTYNWVIEIK